MQTNTLLNVRDLRVTLQTSRGPAAALRGIELQLARGETLGLIGESGCGKSMLALALMGLLPEGARVEGSIRLDGRELVGLGETELCKLRGDRIGMVFQEPMTALNPLHTICRPIVCKGFSAVIGSWNTMPMRLPRNAQNSASSLSLIHI